MAIQVSVIVLNWNGRSYLEECFNSLREQTFNNFEVILVDNASTDDSVEFVQKNFPEVTIIQLDQNYGFSKGNNEGIKVAKGDYIVLLNNDTKADKNWLKAMMESLKNKPGAGFCASKVLFYYDNAKIDSAGDCYTVACVSHKIGHLQNDSADYALPKYVFGASASSVMYRRVLFEEVGFLDEDFFHGHEDADFSFRAQLLGYKCLYVPEAIVYHKVSATMDPKSDNYVYYSQRNMEYVYLKNIPARLLLKYFIFHLFYNLGALVYFIRKGKLKPFLKAKISFFKNFGKMYIKRRNIQKTKKVASRYIDSILERNWFKLKIGKALR